MLFSALPLSLHGTSSPCLTRRVAREVGPFERGSFGSHIGPKTKGPARPFAALRVFYDFLWESHKIQRVGQQADLLQQDGTVKLRSLKAVALDSSALETAVPAVARRGPMDLSFKARRTGGRNGWPPGHPSIPPSLTSFKRTVGQQAARPHR